jgi:hypothetical protein
MANNSGFGFSVSHSPDRSYRATKHFVNHFKFAFIKVDLLHRSEVTDSERRIVAEHVQGKNSREFEFYTTATGFSCI